ncbi:hypothetical protein GCM10010404_71830 [Nonomuraea africana]
MGVGDGLERLQMGEHIVELHVVGERAARRREGQRHEQMGDHAGQRGKLFSRGYGKARRSWRRRYPVEWPQW